MKLNKGDRIHYEDSIYEVAAVIMATIYLRAVKDGKEKYDYEMLEVREHYRDIEFIGKEIIHG